MTGSIEKFNMLLNESVSFGESLIKWKSFRDSVTSFALDGIKKNSTAIILGAGNMLDIDLIRIKKAVGNITLADIDTGAVKRGIKNMDDTDSLTVMKSDLGSLDLNNVMQVVSDSIKSEDIVKLENFLKAYRFKSGMKELKYSYVMVSALYTQLFITQFLMMMQQSVMDADAKNSFIETALGFSARLISHVNDTIIRIAGSNGIVCAWSDILEYSTDDPALTDIENHINDKLWMDEFFMIYVRDHGHGLGSYGITDLADRLNNVRQRWLLWPFNSKRTLVVRIIRGTVTS